uniref:Tyrosine-protein kinase n=1 Tax=Caenorhabditis japonica TaxID=281687 RepID=A0A8R1I9Q6_CAEJA
MNSANFDQKISKWLMDQNFYHGFLPREDLTYLLKKKGDYIVRANEKCIGKERKRVYVLSIAWPTVNTQMITSNDIKSIHIDRNYNNLWLDVNRKFPSIGALFDYYKSSEIVTAKESLRLLRPIKHQFWEFKHSQILLVKKVGQGAYGEVYKGKVKKGKKTFDAAIKAMRRDLDAGDEKMKEVMAEARLMRSLNHPNIVRCRGIAVLEQPVYIVIDFITGGGLDSYLKKNGSKMSIDERNKMAISAAWGIEFMHSHDIIHRDIAARNCLYDKKNHVKLSDFGLSRQGSVYKMKKATKMPTRWLAPESLTTFTFTRASDVYTYGVLLYEIYTCREPYQTVNGGEARKLILSGSFPDFEQQAPPELYSIVQKKVYQLNPANRGTMIEIVKQLEHWLQVELVLDDDDPPAEAESARAISNKKTDESNGQRTKTKKSPNATTTTDNSADRVTKSSEAAIQKSTRTISSKETKSLKDKSKTSQEKDSGMDKRRDAPDPNVEPVSVVKVTQTGDTRDMDMIEPPDAEEPQAGSPGKEFDSVKAQAKNGRKSSER